MTTIDRQTHSQHSGHHPAVVTMVIAAPLLFLAGQALLPVMPETLHGAYTVMLAHTNQSVIAQLLTAAGAFLLAPAAIVYCRNVPEGRGRRLLVGGAVAFGVATFFNALSQVVEAYTTQITTAPGIDRAVGEQVMGELDGGSLITLPLGFWSIPVFALAAIVMALGLLRSRRVPVWLPVLLIVGTVLAGALAGLGPIVALTQLPVTVALLVLGLRPLGFLTTTGARTGERSSVAVR